MVDALLLRDWVAVGNKKLTELLPWGDEKETQADALANSWLNRDRATATSDVRITVASAMLASQNDASTYEARELDRKMAASIVRHRGNTARFRDTRRIRLLSRPSISESQADADQQKYDRDRGREISTLLTQWRL